MRAFKVIEHAHLIDDATAKYMADKGIWLSTQPFLAEEGTPFKPGSIQYIKEKAVRGRHGRRCTAW